MNNTFRIKEYLRYVLQAKGVSNMHSPFVYDFMLHVLYDKRHFYAYDEIERLRSILLSSDEEMEVTDFGAGGKSGRIIKRPIGSILKTSSKPPHQAQLLFRIAEHYQCRNIIELGTSLGISTMYLAASGKKSKVITLEGAPQLAARAQNNFNSLGMKNIEMLTGEFSLTLPLALQKSGNADLIFFDGNHRKEPTLSYFQQSLHAMHEDSVFIFDDIHWSVEMKKAWKIIQANEQVTLSIDLFHLGIVFFRKQLSKQNFTLRF